MPEVTFHPSAVEEAAEAVAYYEGQRPGLGLSLREAISVGVVNISKHPIAWAPMDGTFRRYLVSGFPYGLIYRIKADTIEIVAVAHSHRNPGYWRGRV